MKRFAAVILLAIAEIAMPSTMGLAPAHAEQATVFEVVSMSSMTSALSIFVQCFRCRSVAGLIHANHV